MRKKRIVVLLVAVVLLLGQAAAAHQSVDPESTLIPFHMQVLENGLRVIVKEIPSYPIAAANVWVGVGAKDDPDGLSGMAHFFEHLMFQGTPSRPLGQIWQETALLGGDINAATSLDFTFYYIVVPSEHIRQAMEIQADALRNSLFDQAQIDRERQVIQEEISMVRESLQTYLLHSSLQELFAGTSYGKPIPGTLEDLARVNRTEILDFYARYYVPNNMVLVVAGNVVAEEIFALARELYGDLEPRPLPPPEYIEVPILERVVHKEEERPVQQSYILLAHPVPGMYTREAAALELASVILAQGRASRLYRQLVERERVVNSISGWYEGFSQVGFFVIEAELEPGQRDRFLEIVRAELQRLQTEPVSEEELARAKAMVRSTVAFGTESSLNVALFLGQAELMGGALWAVNYSAMLDQLTAEDIQRAAQLYLSPDGYVHNEIRPEGGNIQ